MGKKFTTGHTKKGRKEAIFLVKPFAASNTQILHQPLGMFCTFSLRAFLQRPILRIVTWEKLEFM